MLEEDQRGEEQVEYGAEVLRRISEQLTGEFGKDLARETSVSCALYPRMSPNRSLARRHQ